MLKVAWAAALACTLVACGLNGAAPTPSPSDAAAPDAGAAPEAGAPDDADLGSDVYPAPHHLQPLMTDLGGPVLKSPRVVTVTFLGSEFTTAIQTAVDTIVTSAWWGEVSAGYGVGPATGGIHAVLPAAVASKVLRNEVEIPALIQGALDKGKLPAPDENTVYAFFFPSTTEITLGSATSCIDFGGFHDSMVVTFEGGSLEVAYAILPDCVASNAPDPGFDTFAASHELIEAATDPHPQTDTAYYNWNDPWSGGYQGGEVADMCEIEPDNTTLVGAYTVATVWSNTAILAGRNPCQPESEPYYAASIQTETLISDWGSGNDHRSDGYVLLHPGETKVVEVDVFSEAPLPSDVKLLVGQPAQTAADPTAVQPIPLVTMTLSQATARNGDKVRLTLTAASDVPLGDTLFVARAVYDTQHMNDWWAILHVF